MNSLPILFKRFRGVLLLATIWGIVPWLVTCIYIPISVETALGNLPPPWTLLRWLFRVFAPLSLFTEGLFSWDLTVVASHMHWPSHYRDWTLFSILNVAFWIIVFGSLKLLIDWLRSWTAARRGC